MIQFRLKELLAERQRIKNDKVSYRQLSAATKLSTNTIMRIANNDAQMIGLRTIDRLCEFFDCKPGDLIIRAK